MYLSRLKAYFAHPGTLSRRVFRAIKSAALWLFFDGRIREKTDLYMDMLHWDAVSQAGVTPSMYGLDGDNCVGPHWRYPQGDGLAHQRSSLGPTEEDGHGGLRTGLPLPPKDVGPRNPRGSTRAQKRLPTRSLTSEASKRRRSRESVAR